jgi:hypothetical protein
MTTMVRALIGNRWRMWTLIILLSLTDVSTVLSLEGARITHRCSSSIYRKFLLQFCPLNLYTDFRENFLDTQSVLYLPNPIEVVEWKREHVFLLSFEHVPLSQINYSVVKYSVVRSPAHLVMQLPWANLQFEYRRAVLFVIFWWKCCFGWVVNDAVCGSVNGSFIRKQYFLAHHTLVW